MIGFAQGSGNSNSPKQYSFEDKNPPSGKLQYRLKQIDFDGKYEYSNVVDVNIDAPAKFELAQNFPNPFNPTTVISYQLPVSGLVTLKVYDVLGKEVANLADGNYEAGKHTATFDGGNLASGIYFYRLITPTATVTKKMVLTK